jgi:hypothetical protein
VTGKDDKITNSPCAEMPDKEIDENLEDTFPASDPPSWTLGTNHGNKACDEENRSHESDPDRK